MEELRVKIKSTESAIQTIREIVDENIKDIGDDFTSDYAKLRLKQNSNLMYAAEQLKEKLEVYGYAE